MTGHFTSYENRTDHELATLPKPSLATDDQPASQCPLRMCGVRNEHKLRTRLACGAGTRGQPFSL
jgi:hypothetical protein